MNPTIAQIANAYFMNPQANRAALVSQVICFIGNDILNNYRNLLTVEQLNCLQNFSGAEFNFDFNFDFNS